MMTTQPAAFTALPNVFTSKYITCVISTTTGLLGSVCGRGEANTDQWWWCRAVCVVPLTNLVPT